MNSVVGVFLALIGLFLIWAWSSGRAEAVWEALWAGSSPSGFTPDAGQAGPSSAGSWGLPSLPQLTNLINAPGAFSFGDQSPQVGSYPQTSGGGSGSLY